YGVYVVCACAQCIGEWYVHVALYGTAPDKLTRSPLPSLPAPPRHATHLTQQHTPLSNILLKNEQPPPTPTHRATGTVSACLPAHMELARFPWTTRTTMAGGCGSLNSSRHARRIR